MSVDGCIAGPNNEMDWLIRGNDSFKYINDIVDSSDTIIKGRKMMDGFIPYLTEVGDKLDDSKKNISLVIFSFTSFFCYSYNIAF